MWFKKPRFSRFHFIVTSFKILMSALQDLQASSDKIATQVDTTVALITQLRAAIATAADDSDALKAVQAKLDEATAKLAAA